MALLEVVFERWLAVIFRWTMIMVPLFLVFWVWKPKWLQRFRIPQIRDVKIRSKHEIFHSLKGISVYAIPIALVAIAKMKFDYSMMYTDISERGIAYLIFTVLVFVLAFDAWIFWTHLAFHRSPFLLKHVHAHHHRSHNTTPFSAYNATIAESLILMVPYVVLVMVMPWHPLALLIFAFVGQGWGAYIHLGYDFGYDRRRNHPVWKWLYSSTHHSLHHQLYEGNYGNYFTFWDKWMGTEVEHSVINGTSSERSRKSAS